VTLPTSACDAFHVGGLQETCKVCVGSTPFCDQVLDGVDQQHWSTGARPNLLAH
jgi:hypothetical protein